jgi:hypothetical protein
MKKILFHYCFYVKFNFLIASQIRKQFKYCARKSGKLKVFLKCASSLGAMHFEKASVQSFFKVILM